MSVFELIVAMLSGGAAVYAFWAMDQNNRLHFEAEHSRP